MKFISTLLGVSSLLLGTILAETDCSNGPWQKQPSSVGGSEGSDFCETKFKQGVIINGIEVWANKETVRAVQFKYSDNTLSKVYGEADGDKHSRLEWDAAATTVDKLTMWGNGKATRLGRIYLRLSDGKELDVGKDTDGQKSYEQDRGSGVMVGAFGKSGLDINMLGILFLGSKVKKVRVSEMKFDDDIQTLNSKKQGITAQVLDEATHTNKKTDSNDTFAFINEVSKRDSKKFSQSLAFTFGYHVDIEISGQVLGLGAKATAGYNWELQTTHTEETESSFERKLTWRTDTIVKPGKTIHCKAFANVGSFDGGYTSKVKVELEDARTFTFTEKGRLEAVSWSEAFSSCEDVPTPKREVLPRRVARGMIGQIGQ
ncbi:hypothetical protein K469DRAFT_567511 [Zopfia rhizophila CBS 207.26]|uniref:Jacalin-type lectin domain-containing protein n=1 Tax=Zopfia rhizophila CBS 207.26 TaxID=1314779 RepID=A0A6A6EA34_9PEZI|nr:hypothetical protein K469DRAFT_567511 [Zopfia rhizophila CBS 207.26]